MPGSVLLAAGATLTVAAGLGLYLGLLYLRRVRRPVLIGIHLLLGAAGLEQVAVMLRGTPNGDVVPAGTLVSVAAGALAAAMFSGLTAPVIGSRSRRNGEAMLVVHVTVGLVGFILFLVWVAGL